MKSTFSSLSMVSIVFAEINFAIAGGALAKPPDNISPLVGTWVNPNLSSQGFGKMEIVAAEGGLLQITLYPNCSCDPVVVSANPLVTVNQIRNGGTSFQVNAHQGGGITYAVGTLNPRTHVLHVTISHVYDLGQPNIDGLATDSFIPLPKGVTWPVWPYSGS